MFFQFVRSASRHSATRGAGVLAATTKTVIPQDLQYLPVVNVNATSNNTFVTAADHEGACLTSVTTGLVGFKNARKSTPYAAEAAGQKCGETLRVKYRIDRVVVKLKGLGPGRASALKGLGLGGIKIEAITDVTPVPHNGCRPKKKRRV